MLSCSNYNSDGEDGDVDCDGNDGNDGHLCRLAMRADVKEWRCHIRSRDLIQHSEVGNEDDFENEYNHFYDLISWLW